MKTKRIDVSKFFDGQLVEVIIKKLSVGDLADIRSSVKVGVLGSNVDAKPDMGQLMLMTLQRGIYKAPFIKVDGKSTMDEIRDIDGDLGEFLLEEIDNFNETNPK